MIKLNVDKVNIVFEGRLNTHQPKHYHLGFGKSISRSNLVETNEKRDCRLSETFAYKMIAKVRKITVPDSDFNLSVKGNVYAFDSITIDLCLNEFLWAYIDFERLSNIDKHDAFFVIRPRNNLQFTRISSNKIDKSTGVMCDQQIMLKGFYSIQLYKNKLRRVKFYEAEQNRTFVFVSNNFELPAIEIAMLYKYRWKISMFFKWIKQHLKIKSFWGTSENAEKIQIYIAIITYTLVVIIKGKLKLKQSPYEILQ